MGLNHLPVTALQSQDGERTRIGGQPACDCSEDVIIDITGPIHNALGVGTRHRTHKEVFAILSVEIQVVIGELMQDTLHAEEVTVALWLIVGVEDVFGNLIFDLAELFEKVLRHQIEDAVIPHVYLGKLERLDVRR